jgi:hypothetical protein
MHKDVMADAGLGFLAQISLLLFVAAFLLIMARAFLTKKDKTEHMKGLPLEDGQLDQDDLSTDSNEDGHPSSKGVTKDE